MEFEPRFGGAAAAYYAFRPEYPPELFERILAELPVDLRQRAMDLGAGTGLSALPLCRSFDEVIAVEPDPRMVEKLAVLDPKIRVRRSTAEECVQDPASVDLVTCGTALHWMDGPRVLENVVTWLRPGGVLAAFNYDFPMTPEPVRAVIRREFELHWEAYRHPRLRDPTYAQRTIAAVRGLSNVQVVAFTRQLSFSIEQLVGFCSSTSYASAYMRTLSDPADYLRGLDSAFRQASPDGQVSLDFELELILAKKP